MQDVARAVLAWHDEGRPGAVVRPVRVTGMSSRWPDEALAVRGAEVVGAVLGGASRDEVVARARAAATSQPADGRGPALLDLRIGDADAVAAGLACGGTARLLVQPTTAVPDDAWQALASRGSGLLVTPLDGPAAGATRWHAEGAPVPEELRAHARAATTRRDVVDTADGAVLVVAVRPVPRLLVLGDGQVAAALHRQVALLGWEATTTTSAADAVAAVAGLGRSDALVVLDHDVAASGSVLAAALDGEVGYVGALGSRGTQALRREWLLAHGTEAAAVDAVRGPAGLDVGARTPAEIAVAIVAEALAVRSGAAAAPLRDRPGPVHASSGG